MFMENGMPRVRSGKKAVNVSISADMLRAARASDINLSATLEAALERELRRLRRNEWLKQSAEAIDAYNRSVEEHGAYSDDVRAF